MPTAVCVFPSGLPAELHSPAEILISLWTLVEVMFQTSPYLRSNSSFWARWSQKLLSLLYSRLAGWQSMCFIWHLKNDIHFLMIIVLAGKRKKIWSHGAKHISWQRENSAAPFLTLSISSHGKYYRTLALLRDFHVSGREGDVDDVPPPCLVSSLCQVSSLPLCNRKQKPGIQFLG